MNWKKHLNKATTITIGNYKGGAGKTTNTTLIGYTLSNLNINTLIVDLDPQSNATKELILTKLINDPESDATINKTLMAGIEEGSLTDLPVKIKNNLSLIPSFIDFEGFAKYLYKNTSNDYEEDFFLKKYFSPLKSQYDLIILDVPPMSIEITKNAVTSSDYVLISLQTQEYSLTGAESYVKELSKLANMYNLDLDVVGVLPVLMKNQGKVDEYILENAKELFGEENIFKTYVPQMERIKRFAVNGITNLDRHDKKVLQVYETITKELLQRLEKFNIQ
ncbi:ParA family protein [Enterococcus faecalis]|uniref:ParA family protein n=1 Tax=Enterococcus faecalis TaxID=1351 RepID=UPI001CF26EF5|nr:ParA family protein [Enterococcus faecalis]MCA6712104.1 ParA family protein [Enterococcus faecalis]MCA6725586.1 ParA family protein [Enterococcus faecalis]MCA6731134.1 ParA family protein [Enterococcus faecalis]MCA6751827.1 ParA family protein [Enterococcus faecalis]MCB5964793.1 ParA family protein [Enterococcus faecalis]